MDVPATRRIRVFIASPGDLAEERRAFKDQIDQLNRGFGDGAAVEFVPLGWEDTLASTGRRVQALINHEIDTCDVFVLAMHRRWGEAAPDSAYSSYTEEEFHRAFDRCRTQKTPEIFVLFKHVDAASMADAGPQLSRVLKFRAELARTRSVRYRIFADAAEFRQEVDQHLRAYTRGQLPAIEVEHNRVPLPLELVERVERAEAEARERVSVAEAAAALAEQQRDEAQAAFQRAAAHEARAEALAGEVATQAAKAALDGRVEAARQLFAKATASTTSLHVLFLAFEFYFRTGDLNESERIIQHALAITGPDSQSTEAANSLSNLGLVYAIRGDLTQAETMHRKSLAIHEQVGHHSRGAAADYCNLGNVYQTRGDLERAEAMHRQALEIHTQLDHREGMAAGYGNLGIISRQRGDLDQAEGMHRKSLAIGTVYRERNDLAQAEAMAGQALELNEQLGRREGMANQCGNLAAIARTRGDLDAARRLWIQARELFRDIRMPHRVRQMDAFLKALDASAKASSRKTTRRRQM